MTTEININEIRTRAAEAFTEGQGIEDFVVADINEFVFSNGIVSGEANSYDAEKALYESLSDEQQAGIYEAVKEEIEAQGWSAY